MLLIDPHEIKGDFLTVPIKINIARWFKYYKGDLPNLIGYKGAHLISWHGAAAAHYIILQEMLQIVFQKSTKIHLNLKTQNLWPFGLC